jgi:hypothetical protein
VTSAGVVHSLYQQHASNSSRSQSDVTDEGSSDNRNIMRIYSLISQAVSTQDTHMLENIVLQYCNQLLNPINSNPSLPMDDMSTVVDMSLVIFYIAKVYPQLFAPGTSFFQVKHTLHYHCHTC